MKLREGEVRNLPDGGPWRYRFDYVGDRPARLQVWLADGEPFPPAGLTGRLLRGITVGEPPGGDNAQRQRLAEDLKRLGIEPLPGPRDRDTYTRLRAVNYYDQWLRLGRTRRELAAKLQVSDAWLKDAVAWARREGYFEPTVRGRRGGQMTPQGVQYLARLMQRQQEQFEATSRG